ncbi:MAG TPA: hypothetical protein VGO97_00120 [Solirubrobacterales bacterium]|nr:hypothetical protein [Solirubrobacterales bacterium]
MSNSWITQAGAIELTAGALSGWIIALSVDKPDVLRRRGVKVIPRLRQAHLDLIIMGTILIALGLAAPDLEMPWSVMLVAGAVLNPLLFVPLAFSPDTQQNPLYRAVTALSFISMSAGVTAAAVVILGG